MVHEHRLAGGLPGLGAVIAHLDLDSDVGCAFFCRDVFGIDVCALGLQVGVEREGGVNLWHDVEEDVANDAPVERVETGEEPAHGRAGLELLVVTINLDMQGIFAAELYIGSDVETQRGDAVRAASQQLAIQVKLSTLADALELENETPTFIVLRHKEVLAIGVGSEILESTLEALVAIPLVVGMRS